MAQVTFDLPISAAVNGELPCGGLCLILLPPHPSRRLRNQLELRLLVLDRQFVADDRGGKTALGAKRKAILVHVARCLVDAAGEKFGFFEPRSLGRDKPEDNHSVIGNVGERRERTRASVVVLEQQPVRADAPEDRFRDCLVVAFDQPAALLVAAAEVEAKGDVRDVAHDRVVELDTKI